MVQNREYTHQIGVMWGLLLNLLTRAELIVDGNDVQGDLIQRTIPEHTETHRWAVAALDLARLVAWHIRHIIEAYDAMEDIENIPGADNFPPDDPSVGSFDVDNLFND